MSAAAAFERRFREAIARGEQPDALRRYCADEAERFWARTVPGPDGHVYWSGGPAFTKNNGLTRRPARWVWEHAHGPLPKTTDVWTTCGEANCLAPEHLAAGRSNRREWYTHDQVIGGLQVVAMRLGHPPNQKEWRDGGGRPDARVVVTRFGSWDKALGMAGLDPAKQVRPDHATRFRVSDDRIVAALHDFVATFGHVPSSWDWHTKHVDWVKRHRHPTSKTILRRLGGWPNALRRAGMK